MRCRYPATLPIDQLTSLVIGIEHKILISIICLEMPKDARERKGHFLSENVLI